MKNTMKKSEMEVIQRLHIDKLKESRWRFNSQTCKVYTMSGNRDALQEYYNIKSNIRSLNSLFCLTISPKVNHIQL